MQWTGAHRTGTTDLPRGHGCAGGHHSMVTQKAYGRRIRPYANGLARRVLTLHHSDDPQQDHRSQDRGEEREPPTAASSIEEEAQQEAADHRTDDADHDVHQNARAAAFDDLACDPPGDSSDDD